MLKNRKTLNLPEQANFRRPLLSLSWLSKALLSALFAVVIASPGYAANETPSPSKACLALQAKFPQLKGKTLVDAINPHTPGYESLDPKDPSKYIGFDIDLAEQLGSCLGFSVTYKPVAFAALIPTMQSGQADLIISDISSVRLKVEQN